MNYIQHSVEKFKIENHLTKGKLTLGRLIKVARRNGYAVYFYSKAQSVMVAYSLIRKSKTAAALTVVDENGNVLIFIDDKQSVQKQTFALAHEIGHVVLHKNTTAPTEQQEAEANKFANYLLTSNYFSKSNVTIFILCILLIIISIVCIFSYINLVYSQTTVPVSQPTGDVLPDNTISDKQICYFTAGGEVYHLYPDCSYIKNSKNISSSEIDTCGKDRLCTRCRSRLEKEKGPQE